MESNNPSTSDEHTAYHNIFIRDMYPSYNQSLISSQITEEDTRPKLRDSSLEQYCQYLCEVMLYDYGSLRVKDLFPHVNGYTKNEINKILIDHLDMNKEMASPLPTDTNIKLISLSQRFGNTKLEDLNNQYRNAKQIAIRAQDVLVEKQAILRKAKEALTFRKPSIKNEIIKTLGFGSYTLGSVTRDSVLLITKPCTITFRRPGDGKRFKVPFGTFRVEIDFNYIEEKVRVYKHENNIKACGNYHPFISNTGNICFGSSGDEAIALEAGGEWSKYLTSLFNLLNTYHDDAYPFVAIEAFYYLGVDKDGLHPWRPDLDTIDRKELSRLVNQNNPIGCGHCGDEDHETDECEDLPYCDACNENVNDDHDCPYVTCSHCNERYYYDEGHECMTTCDVCDEEYDRAGLHECPPEEPKENEEIPF